MSLQIHNTLTGRMDTIAPGGSVKNSIKDYPVVTMYSCGPTVYSFAHIGNFRTFVFNDLLRRYLKFSGFKLDHAVNITDVDDKTIAGSHQEGMSLSEYTQKYADIFFEDLKTLNIEKAEHYPRATESVDAMIDLIQRLIEKGMAYEKEGSIYFSIDKFKEYGKLSRLDRREIKDGARYDSDSYEKDDVRDFALWKSVKEGEPGWETPFGTGRPGWHIECSAMVRKIFNSTIDIHTGGVDLIFPHHENEIAQSEAAYDEPFVRYWIHAEHLLVDGTKMSKSLGNFYTLRDLLDKGYSPRSIRYLLLSVHYRKQHNFTLAGLKQAENALDRFDNLIIRLMELPAGGNPGMEVKKLTEQFLGQFSSEMDADLNISGALGKLFDFIHAINSLLDQEKISGEDRDLLMNALTDIDRVLGVIFFPVSEKNDTDTERIDKLIQERLDARKEKNFTRADEIRAQLEGEGIILEDTKDGTRWKRKK